MNLSKSKYCLAWQCPKMLWLSTYKPELAEVDASTEGRFAVGSEIGELAKSLFGEYSDVTVFVDNGALDLASMIEKTRELVDCSTRNICEAAFSFNGLYCAVDILRRQNGGYAIYEVKSSAHFKRIYAVDVAYQKYVLQKCGINVTGVYLICINGEYVRGEKLDVKKLFRIVDISQAVEEEYPDVERVLKTSELTLGKSEEPKIDISEGCFSPYDCAYFKHCSAHIPSPSVFDLYRLPLAEKLDRYRRGAYSFQDLCGCDEFTSMQKRQMDFALNDRGTYVDRKNIAAFLSKLYYPLYFLDFETMQLAVPQFVGTKPYSTIPFQYSLHYIECEGGEVKHKEFLAVSGEDPRRAIADSLCEDIPRNACVLAYNKAFECGRINELALLFPDLASHLTDIKNNIIDLIEPFRKGYYYNKRMGGSFSIKSVLPAIFPDDPSLNYHNLDGVHNGVEAMDIFPRIKDMPGEEQARAREQLLRYCELDTLAMVRIWQELNRVVYGMV